MYLSVMFFFIMLVVSYCIRDWIDKMKRKKLMRLAREKEYPSELPVIDLVGKSTTAFLAPLQPESIQPVMCEDLEKEYVTAAETEPDVHHEEVEATLNAPYIPDDDELAQYAGDNADVSDEFSQGLTFEQISQAVEVVHGRKSGETEELLAGEALNFMPSDFLDVICMQADHEAAVKKLIAGYLDFPGKMKPIPVTVANFDINNYV
jgi:hypothetical protein